MTVQKYKSRSGRIDPGALLLAGIASLAMLAFIFLPAQVTFLNHTYIVTQGALVFGMIVFALFWAAIEMYTPPGTGLGSLLIRFFGTLIIGLLLGGFLGQELFFGAYVLIPIAQMNPFALFFVIMMMVFFFVLIATAVWFHNSTYLIARNKPAKKASRS